VNSGFKTSHTQFRIEVDTEVLKLSLVHLHNRYPFVAQKGITTLAQNQDSIFGEFPTTK
jgi:hypothetical protein